MVAGSHILSKLKETQKVLMQRQLKQRCYIERDGRMGLPVLMHDLQKVERAQTTMEHFHTSKRKQSKRSSYWLKKKTEDGADLLSSASRPGSPERRA
eukprot:CAMPEP_0170468414 /NCGR_PEP_ID=MMETSP0123-20130129/11607_1 /TAXON_ID=182087 /ORGANISM="Favella ehrenbergii, Strain Fehren 1" /LENGTH=96 /DNA_ID=CAMNT_0010734985 /DNA_START=822 /DNA_END=1112 /DNA_ORIENTATION=-